MTAARVSAETLQPAPIPRLLVELPSRPRVFFSNLRDLIFPRRLARLELRSAPAPFWPDVFVKRGLPWFGFLQSCAWHCAAFLLLVEVIQFLALQPPPVPRPVFDRSQLIYYSAEEYLPPLDTRVAQEDPPSFDKQKADEPKPADPEFSRQPIISLPPEADNRSQTIVTPPNVKLKHDVALPNVVAWPDAAQKPRLAIPAAPLTPAAELSRIASPTLQASVVAPPPEVRVSPATVSLPKKQLAVIAPPPSVDATPMASRAIGDINMGRSSVIAPAPQLAVEEQGAWSAIGIAAAPQVVPPPPALSGSTSAGDSLGSPGRVVALNLHPAVDPPPDPPVGNRRGIFAATPEGRVGASGLPGSAGGGSAEGGSAAGNGGGAGTNRNGNSDLPAGLYVGSAPASRKTASVAGDPSSENAPSGNTALNPAVVASASLPHANAGAPASLRSESTAKLSDVERSIFLGRQFFSLTLNMPNLNSAGGSWVVRFAELHPDPNSSGELSAPVAKVKVDPGYPLQLMRQNVTGTVILYAIIHTDGTVGNIRVLRSLDPRLDQRASQAVSEWQFQPATRNGIPVEVEATFQIPFKPLPLDRF